MSKINVTCHKSRHPIMPKTPNTEYINTSSVYKYSQVFQNKKKETFIIDDNEKKPKIFCHNLPARTRATRRIRNVRHVTPH